MINKRRLRMKERKKHNKRIRKEKGNMTREGERTRKKCDEEKDDDNLLVQGFEQRPGPDKDTIHNN